MRAHAPWPWLPLVVFSFWICRASPASAVTIDWAIVVDPGNACHQLTWICSGSVPYAYRISKQEVTNAQYAEFLNAKAASDPLGLYSTQMGTTSFGGIQRGGGPGSYTYTPIAGREAKPVNYVSFYDAIRFANWMHNGQGSGDTETGAYTLLGGMPNPTNEPLMRNGGAAVFIPTDGEWYKAAYYDAGSASYFAYPAGSDDETSCATPGPASNTANCGAVVGSFTDVGSYTGSASPSGTFDQGGNIFEWTDEIPVLENRFVRGGWYNSSAEWLAGNRHEYDDPWSESATYGFRVAGAVPGAGAVSGLIVHDPGATWLEWDFLPGGGSGTYYDLVRGDVSSLSGDASGIELGTLICIRNDTPLRNSQLWPDTDVPAPGAAFFYLVRFQNDPVVGTWGIGSVVAERAGIGGCGP